MAPDGSMALDGPAHPRLHAARIRGPGHPDLRVPGRRGHPGREHPTSPTPSGSCRRSSPNPASGARPSVPPPWPTPPVRHRAPTAAGSSTSTTPAGKRSITVDARHPKGLALLKDLVARLRRRDRELRGGDARPLGPRLRRHAQIRPDIIYVSMCGFGHDGPDTAHVTMGPTAQALTGLTFMVGPPRPARRRDGRSPTSTTWAGTSAPSPSSPALLHRGRTGEGQHIDVSQLEPATALSGALLLDAMLNDTALPPTRLPHGQPPRSTPRPRPVAPTGPPGRRPLGRHLVPDRGPVGRAGRGHGQPAVDRRSPLRHPGRPRRARRRARRPLEAWTSERDRYEVMDLLQSRRCPCRRRPGRRRPPRARPATGGPRPLHRCSAMPRSARCPSRASPSGCRRHHRTPVGVSAAARLCWARTPTPSSGSFWG